MVVGSRVVRVRVVKVLCMVLFFLKLGGVEV